MRFLIDNALSPLVAEELRAARNFDESTIREPRHQVSHSVARKVARDGVPLLTANAIDDPRLASATSTLAPMSRRFSGPKGLLPTLHRPPFGSEKRCGRQSIFIYLVPS